MGLIADTHEKIAMIKIEIMCKSQSICLLHILLSSLGKFSLFHSHSLINIRQRWPLSLL